jgi:tRNA(adenine34) deaminase
MESKEHERCMDEALGLAEEAAGLGEVPVGAVVVIDGKTVGKGANQRESLQDPFAHAELIAMREASAAVGSWRLEKATLYVTLEPCPMCAGAIVNARVPVVVYGCDDPKAGAVRTLYKLLEDPRLNHRCEVISGVRAEKASSLLSAFFSNLRRSKTPSPAG